MEGNKRELDEEVQRELYEGVRRGRYKENYMKELDEGGIKRTI